ncbi:MAG: class I SAM-dependent methyltransferase [Acidobacteria bacterium]|nr:class I SAM-dependent methyltransferase [Acidobacteriota bacterium]
MNTAINFEVIKKWEKVEVERSAGEAGRRESEDLRLTEENIKRYLNPPADTPYYLEYAYHLLGDARGLTVLDYGCGAGENSALIAFHGAEKVIGIDISPELIELGKRRLALHGVGENADLRVGSAHELPLAAESVDVVFGIAILHHLDLELASAEVFRVLKKGGRAIFLEPVRNSRFIRFVRKLIPYRSPDVSPFERPLTEAELERFAARFTSLKSRAFSIPFVNLIEVLGLPESLLHKAIRLDGKILRAAPFLKNLASVRVVEMRK